MAMDKARDLVIAARATNIRRAEMDLAGGFAPPEHGPPDMTLRTVLCALMSGMQTDDWNCVAEAYDILCSLHRQVTGKKYDPVCDGP
jgi:hypothetical protein